MGGLYVFSPFPVSLPLPPSQPPPPDFEMPPIPTPLCFTDLYFTYILYRPGEFRPHIQSLQRSRPLDTGHFLSTLDVNTITQEILELESPNLLWICVYGGAWLLKCVDFRLFRDQPSSLFIVFVTSSIHQSNSWPFYHKEREMGTVSDLYYYFNFFT